MNAFPLGRVRGDRSPPSLSASQLNPLAIRQLQSAKGHLVAPEVPRLAQFEAAIQLYKRAMAEPEPQTSLRRRRILWNNVLTVVSAAFLISAEVFGAAFAGSWAVANLFALGTLAARLLDGLFVLCGIVVMVQFVRTAQRIEPFSELKTPN
jgi:hypothetical protein